ncbi:MAG TPA: hypothetical protein VHX61_10640 [Rhizomicrobium sp.]|jgi:hypothetical protein|nr:hypothetical protein [Rhizomicrobium sp.]
MGTNANTQLRCFPCRREKSQGEFGKLARKNSIWRGIAGQTESSGTASSEESGKTGDMDEPWHGGWAKNRRNEKHCGTEFTEAGIF